LLIYRIRASHIGLVQLQDKIVVRFALTIYPYSIGNQGLDVFGHHTLIPSRRIFSTMVLSDIGPFSNC